MSYASYNLSDSLLERAEFPELRVLTSTLWGPQNWRKCPWTQGCHLPCGIIVLGIWLRMAPLIRVGAAAVAIMPWGQTKPGCMPYWVHPYWAKVIGEIIPFAAICCILRMARSFSVSANFTTIEDDAPWKVRFKGVLLDFSLLSGPYLALVFTVSALDSTLSMIFFRNNCMA